MRCSFCGKDFNPETAKKECSRCSMVGACKKIKCPHCDYEMPAQSSLVSFLKKIKNFFNKNK